MPDLEFFIEVQVEMIRDELNRMSNDVDSPEDWHQELIEAPMFEEHLKEINLELMFRPYQLTVVRELHARTGCSMYMAYNHMLVLLREFYKQAQEAVSAGVAELEN